MLLSSPRPRINIFLLTNRTRLPSGRHIKLMNLFHLSLGFRIHLCPANQLLAKINREKVWQQTDHSKPNQRQPNTHARQAKAAPNHVEPQQGQASEAASGPSKPRPTPPSNKTIKRNKRAQYAVPLVVYHRRRPISPGRLSGPSCPSRLTHLTLDAFGSSSRLDRMSYPGDLSRLSRLCHSSQNEPSCPRCPAA